MLHLPQTVVAGGIHGGDGLVEMAAVGIGDEYLSEGVRVRHCVHDTVHTVGVELIENIIDRRRRSYCAKRRAVVKVLACPCEAVRRTGSPSTQNSISAR